MRLAADNRAIAAVWVATRGLIAFLIFWVSRNDLDRLQDVRYYLESAQHVAELHQMPATEMWQYPPGAAFVLLVPLLAGAANYAIAFVACMLAVDAAITVLLVRFGRRTGSLLGVWAWLLAMPAMREYPLLRFDLVPTLFAVAALTWAVRRPVVFGVLAGLGTFVKAWPIVVVAAQRRLVPLLVAGAVALAVFVGGTWATGQVFGDQRGALDNQAGRGLQNEAVAATPWHVAGVASGDGAPLHYGSGATEVNDPRAERVADTLRWVTVAAAALMALWWVLRGFVLRGAEGDDAVPSRTSRHAWLASPSANADLVAVALLLAIVTSRVLSPQFMVWMLGVTAVALAFPDTRLRRPLFTVLAGTLLTFAVLKFPVVLSIRNVLLAIAAVDATALLFLGLRARDDVERPVTDLLDLEPAAARDAQHVGDPRTLA